MSATTRSLDATSKRWLVVLAAVSLASVAFLTHLFVKVLSPEEENVAATQQPASEAPEQTPVRTEPSWMNPRQVGRVEDSQAARQDSPFDKQIATPKSRDEAQKEIAHQQADYLRKLIANGKLPAGLGNLTKEDVDEMEKKGIIIQ
jgi:hypothetical protein